MRAVNLIPGDQRSSGGIGAGRSGGAAYALLAVLGAFAVLAVMYGKASRVVSSDKSKAASLNAHAAQDKAAAEQLAPYTSFVALRQQREQAVTTIVDTRFDWAHAMHELGRVIPAGVSVGSLTGQVGSGSSSTSATTPAPAASSTPGASASAVASATPAGSVPTFTLSGCAHNQKTVALLLQRLRLMDGVTEVTLQNSTKGTGAGSAGSGGGCPPHAPVYNVTITYEALPSASQSAAATRTKSVSDTAAGAAPAPSTPSPGGKTG